RTRQMEQLQPHRRQRAHRVGPQNHLDRRRHRLVRARGTCARQADHRAAASEGMVAARVERWTSVTEEHMPKILVIHGAGMNMRGKVQVEIFGPMTLPEYDERIRGYAKELGVEVEIFHSNVEGEIVNRLYAASDQGFDAAIFNPAAFGTGYPALVAAISQVKFPTTEVHISNPMRRGPASQTAAVSLNVVAGFGIAGYALALRGIRDMLAAKK